MNVGLGRLALALLVIACVLASQGKAFSGYEPIDAIASKLAGRNVTIRCLTEEESESDLVLNFWGAEAYVEGWSDGQGRWHPYSYAVFRHGHCENLLALLADDLRGRTLYDVSWSILALTHESGHLRGKPWAGSEAKTQCWAMQHIQSTLNLLGIKDSDARRLVLWQVVWIHKFDLAVEYQLPECRLPTP